MTNKIDKSGFPLQLAIKDLVTNQDDSGWKVWYEERGWIDPRTGGTEFIDLVIHNESRKVTAVLEVKKVQSGEWVFFVPKPDDTPSERFKPWITKASSDLTEISDLLNAAATPDSLESQYCHIFGQDERNPALDRIGATLVEATEQLAKDEKYLISYSSGWVERCYIPVIVTTAKLIACRLDPSQVDIETGVPRNEEVDEVPYIRYRKQLSKRTVSGIPEENVREARLQEGPNESTLFIVNTAHLQSFLEKLKIW